MKGENALVFGATGGLGSSICKSLVEKGVTVYPVARSKRKLIELAEQLKLNPEHMYHFKSITAEKDFKKARIWLKSHKVDFRYAIHTAGQGLMKPAHKISLKEWSEVMDINLTSSFVLFKLFWEVRSPEGFELVFFSSASLDQSWPKNSLYGASKAGLEAFAQSLQEEVKNVNGRVWLYRAGSINTGFFDRIKKHLPFDKMLSADDVADLVVSNFQKPPEMLFPVIPVLTR
jgi:short-subunit dehydrogenase